MEPAVHHLIEAIHQAPCRCVLALTGGGASAIGLLLSVPGGSRTVLEARVPYDEQALVEYLGFRPESFCSAATARDMAHRAHERANWSAPGQPVVGLGCTASLATDRPKRGEHRFYLAIRAPLQLTTYQLTLTKGARDREAEENVLCRILVNALAEACAVKERVEVPLLPGETPQAASASVEPVLEAFFKGELAALQVDVDGRIGTTTPRPGLLVPGAFNPLHAGHRGLVAAASQTTGHSAAYELSVVNVDKPPLTVQEVRRRLRQFAWHAPVWLTRAPTFAEKAAVFPGALFAVGVDTALRIVAPRYYQDSEAQMAAALDQIRVMGCKFLVAGRVDSAGKFVGLEDVAMPGAYRDLFMGLPESAFRLDLSSSELRGERLELPKA